MLDFKPEEKDEKLLKSLIGLPVEECKERLKICHSIDIQFIVYQDKNWISRDKWKYHLCKVIRIKEKDGKVLKIQYN